MQATDLLPDTTYYYRFAAANDAGTAWGLETASFITGQVWLETVSDASEIGAVPGTVTVHRAASATNEALTVAYAVGGTATPGVDYAALSGAVVMPAGEATAAILVVPYADHLVEGTEMVVLTLLPGRYVLAPDTAATVEIEDLGTLTRTWSGGGALCLVVGGSATLDGLVTAQGGNAANNTYCSGAGGSILIDADALAGSGTVQAGVNQDADVYYGSGGGRVSLCARSNGDFSKMTVRANTHPQERNGGGRAGTVFLSAPGGRRLIIDQQNVGTASANYTWLPSQAVPVDTSLVYSDGALADAELIITNGASVRLTQDMRVYNIPWLEGSLALNARTLYVKADEPGDLFPGDFGNGTIATAGVFYAFRDKDELIRDGRLLWGNSNVTWQVITVVKPQAGGATSINGEQTEGYYVDGSEVTVEAAVAQDFTFFAWDGSGIETMESANPWTIAPLSGNLALRAWFNDTRLDAATNSCAAAPINEDWFDPLNWSLLAPPSVGQNVVIPDGVTLRLTNSTPELASLTLNGGTLICNYWETRINAGDVVLNSGVITTPGPFNSYTNIFWPAWIPSNRVAITCHTLTVGVDGMIDVNGKGFLAGWYDVQAQLGTEWLAGHGPGGGGRLQGASYGAKGGGSSAKPPYGDPTHPLEPGSGGGSEYHLRDGSLTQAPGHGGGAIEILAEGAVTVNGVIAADGKDVGYLCGGGSGGGIYIACGTIAGSGKITAIGGRSTQHRSTYATSGSGGRIAITYDPQLQRALPKPSLTLSANSRLSRDRTFEHGNNSTPGSLYLPDDHLLGLQHSGNWMVEAATVTQLAYDQCDMTHAWLILERPGFLLAVTNALNVCSAGRLELAGGEVVAGSLSLTNFGVLALHACGGESPGLRVQESAVLENQSFLYVASGPTNGVSPYGVRVAIGNALTVANQSWIYPQSDAINGGSVLFNVGSLDISADCGFNADHRGYGATSTYGYGPGGGFTIASGDMAGGAYGGLGGRGINNDGSVTLANTYGSAERPAAPGSGGTPDAAGGGLIRISAVGAVHINGLLTANGKDASSMYNGGGSGGGIYVTGKTFGGSGTLAANGGKGGSLGWRGGGGGGRIAVWRLRDQNNEMFDNASVFGGTTGASGLDGADGTVFWGFLPPPATLIILR